MGFFSNTNTSLTRPEANKIRYKKLIDQLYELHLAAGNKSLETLRCSYFTVMYYKNVNQDKLPLIKKVSQGKAFAEYYPYVEDGDVYSIGEQIGKMPDIKEEIKMLLTRIFEGIADRDNQFILQVRYRDANRLETIDVKPRIK